jgi:hypothetical protein
MTTIDRLFIRFGAYALEKQLYLSSLFDDDEMPAWQFSKDAGTLTLNEDLVFSVQLLGTEADAGPTWLWAWANDASDIPPDLLQAAQQVKQYGHTHEVETLTDDDAFPIEKEKITGHRLSMIASGICDANAYYRGTYAGGALYMLIMDDNYPQDERLPAERITDTFPQFIQQMQVFDHQAAFEAYLKAHALVIRKHREDGQPVISGKQVDGTTVKAVFDDQQRLTQLSTIQTA